MRGCAGYGAVDCLLSAYRAGGRAGTHLLIHAPEIDLGGLQQARVGDGDTHGCLTQGWRVQGTVL